MNIMQLISSAVTCGLEQQIRDETAGLDPQAYTKVGTMPAEWREIYAAYQARSALTTEAGHRQDHIFRKFIFDSLALEFGTSFRPLCALVASDGSVFVPNEAIAGIEFPPGKVPRN